MAHLKKFGALLLALVLVLSLSAPAFADTAIGTGDDASSLNGGTGTLGASGEGELGGYVDPDTPILNDKVVRIFKEIKVYNPDADYVYGPAINYTYAITAASGAELENKITDATTDHASGKSTVFGPNLLAGPTPANVVVTGQDNDGSTVNQIRWLNTDILNASAAGTANLKWVKFDFSSINFSQPGVYRYKITETVASYNTSGVTEGTSTHVRYLDVYVMRSSTYDVAHEPSSFVSSDWRVYGYVCLDSALANDDVDTSTVKTDGFITSATVTADEYKTYNMTVSKDLVNDPQMIDHKFPFEISFDTSTNSITGTFQLIAEQDTGAAKSSITTSTNSVASGAATVNSTTKAATGKPTSGAVTGAALLKIGSAQVLSASPYQVKIADGDADATETVGYVKLIGIPYGAIASVKETNDVTGTTYTATVKEDVTTVAGTTLAATTWTATTGVLSDDSKSAAIDNTKTATRTADVATANTGDKNVAVQVTNTLAIISPTGVAFRVAPYVLMLGAGIVLFALSRKRKAAEEA